MTNLYSKVSGLKSKGINALAINSETMALAGLESPRRDLWTEAATGQYQMIFFGPETMRTNSYSTFVLHPIVRQRIALFCVDEIHLGDEWGVDFRMSYDLVVTMRARLSEHTGYLGLSASVEKGQQTENVIRLLGLRRGEFHFEKRDCERYNVDIIVRDIVYNCSGYEFRDLDWLIPIGMMKASDVPKYLLYCESIELGHRIVLYLRKLLPHHLQARSHSLIRHMHSLNCPECKNDGLQSLYKSGEARDCALFVTTAILEVGFDLPDLDGVVMYGPTTVSGIVQRAGRPARGKDMRGTAIVYFKKSDIQATSDYLNSDELLDPRLLASVEHEASPVPREEGTIEPEPATNGIEALSPSTTKTKKPKQKKTITSLPPPGKRKCLSLRLVIAAHIRKCCITRQINVIYDNPGASRDCGRCSSCRDYPIPEPRPIPTTVVISERPSSTDTTPTYLRLTGADTEYANEKIEAAAHAMWSCQWHPDAMFLSARCFLSPGMIKRITHDFHLVRTKVILQTRMDGWRYWDTFNVHIWGVVEGLGKEMEERLELRHENMLEKQRAQRVKKQLVSWGLDNVKRVILRVPAPSTEHPDTTSVPCPQDLVSAGGSHRSVADPVSPADFYANDCSRKRALPLELNVASSSAVPLPITKRLKRSVRSSRLC